MISLELDLEAKNLSKDLARVAADALHAELIEASIFRSCLSCLNFDAKKEVCLVCRPAQRPPAKTVVFGCPAWELDIPF